jgi:hypothetical protein
MSVTSELPKSTAVGTHVVVLVHGIRDYALWQDSIRSTLEGAGFKAELTNFNRFNLIKFLLPIWFFRRQAIEDVWRQIRIIFQNNPNTPISVIAHSFGTFVISHLMKEEFDLKFHRIIFCGSVVPYNFSYEQIQDRFVAPILNEVGTRDIWPALAESITSGYGSAGTYGFRRPLVRDRWHNGAGHGYFLDAAFCRKYWVPFLSSGRIVEGSDLPESPKLLVRLFSIVKLKYILSALAVLLAVFAYANGWFHVSEWFQPAKSKQVAVNCNLMATINWQTGPPGSTTPLFLSVTAGADTKRFIAGDAGVPIAMQIPLTNGPRFSILLVWSDDSRSDFGTFSTCSPAVNRGSKDGRAKMDLAVR